MPRENYHDQVKKTYMTHMALRDVLTPALEEESVEDILARLTQDIITLKAIENTRYLRSRTPIPKAGNLHLAWQYAADPALHPEFVKMLRVSPLVFNVILELIQKHTVFQNNSNVPQTPVDIQLAVALYRLGRFGNAASVADVAVTAGVGVGSVELFTDRVFTAIEDLHDQFVRPLTAAEKEVEKQWMDTHLGFRGLWREGWIMYDGTIVVLFAKPGMNGEAYYTRKGNYGLNVQIGNVPSNLRIADYSHGMTGSAHDSVAFEHTCAHKHPDWLFDGEEFAWADSAYTLNSRTIPVHKRPAALTPENTIFDKTVSHLRIRSEHCMGALKGRWQALRGLRVTINSNDDHIKALRWITVAIILHNLIIDVEGSESGAAFRDEHGRLEEEDDRGPPVVQVGGEGGEDAGEQKRLRLTAELLVARGRV